MTLYEELGVGKTASEDEIKAAYKKAAKRTHPDAGGDADAFEKIKQAKRILLNPNARKKYDDTGAIDESDLRTEQDQAFSMAMQAIYNAIAHFETAGSDLFQCDLVGEASRQLTADIQTCEKSIRGTEKAALKLQELARRFRPKHKNGSNRIAIALKTRAAEFARLIAQHKERLALLQMALEIVDAHIFDCDEKGRGKKIVIDVDLIRTNEP